MSGGNLKQGITAYSDDTPDLVMTTAFINVEKITLPLSNETCIVYDMSGQGRYREQWQYFYPDIDGIFFVIDATDKEKDALMLTPEYVETFVDSPFLFLAADLPPPPLFKDEFRENIIPQVGQKNFTYKTINSRLIF